MAERRIPDRSAEPALQASLDHGPKATTATNSDEEPDAVPLQAPPEAPPEAKEEPDADEVEKMTGVPADSQELSAL
jgi:hypothetical protein